MPSGFVTPTAGGGSRPQLYGPFALAHGDTNVVNPGNGYGALVGPTFAAGSVIGGAWAINTVEWAAAGGFDEFDLNLRFGTGTTSLSVLSAVGVPDPDSASAYALSVSPIAPGLTRLLLGSARVAFSAWSTNGDPVTAGAANIYILALAA